MTMVYDNRPATKDIDCIFSETNYKLLESILELLKSKDKLFLDSLYNPVNIAACNAEEIRYLTLV